MSNYTINDIENLVKRCNNSNKKIIINTIQNIIEEDNKLNIKLLNIQKINNIFFKIDKNYDEINKYCTICQKNIKSKEHKVKLSNCDHLFHKKCLNKYLKVCLTIFSCPNCKNNYKNKFESIAKNISNN